VVTAVVLGVEKSAPSNEALARPLPPNRCASNRKRHRAKDALGDPSAVVLMSLPSAVGYNIYRGCQLGVATYLNDPAKVTKFANVTAPFTDTTNLTTATYYYYVVTASVQGLRMWERSFGEAAVPPAGRRGGGGGDEGRRRGLRQQPVLPDIFATDTPERPEDQRNLAGCRPVRHAANVRLQHRTAAAVDRDADDVPFFDSSTAVSIGGITYYRRPLRVLAGRVACQCQPTMEVIVDWVTRC